MEGKREVSSKHFVSYGGGVHPTAIIGHPPESRNWTPSQHAHVPAVGACVRIEAYVTVDAGTERPTTICDGAWLMKHVHVGHDAFVGAGCELSPGAVVSGHATLDDGVRVGVNASILPYVHVGEGAVIGAGAVVTRHVPAGETWAGNPARKIEPSQDRRSGRMRCGCLPGEPPWSGCVYHSSGDG